MKSKTTFLTVLYSSSVVLASLFFLFLVAGKPILADPRAVYDDALFFRGLDNILRGEWLGQYDKLTLVKGPMLSMIGSLSAAIGVKAKFFEAFIYLSAAITLFLTVRRFGLHSTAALVLFIVLLCNPHIWSNSGGRYLRNVLYSAFFLFSATCLMIALFSPERKAGNLSALGVGFFAGCAFLTREEDIWVFSTLATIIVISLLINIIRHGVSQALSYWKPLVSRASIAAVALTAVVYPVMLVNHAFYGRYVISEFRDDEFRSAIGSLMRVGDVHPSGYVPVSAHSLEVVFKVSQVAADLQKYWPSIVSNWRIHGAHLISQYPGEIAGGWFVWAFRDAVAAAGHHTSATVASEFYAQLAKEIDTACDDGVISCREKRITLAPVLTRDRIPSFLAALKRALSYTAKVSGDEITALRSQGSRMDLLHWDRLIGPVVVDAPKEYLLSGWVANLDGTLDISALSTTSTQISELSFDNDQIVTDYFESRGEKGVGAVRFSMVAGCLTDSCTLNVTNSEGASQTVSLKTPMPGQMSFVRPFVGYFDIARERMNTALQPYPLERFRISIIYASVKLAQYTISALTFTATAGIFLFIIFWRHSRNYDWLFVLALGSATAVIGRAIIIAYIEVTSWQAINVDYLGPAYPFMIIFGVTGTAIFSSIAYKKVRRE